MAGDRITRLLQEGERAASPLGSCSARQDKAASIGRSRSNRPSFVALMILCCVALGLVGGFLVGSLLLDLPAFAALVPTPLSPQAATALAPAAVSPTRADASAGADASAHTPTSASIHTPTPRPFPSPAAASTPAPIASPLRRPPMPTPLPFPPTSPPVLPRADSGIRWIGVDLTNQELTAYVGQTPVRQTPVSTGRARTPTPDGTFRIYLKLRYDDMAGPGYYLRDVPYTMYFHRGYGLHGTYWHSNFGHPMSHGCVNLPTSEAKWLYSWAEIGTLVIIHY